MPWALASRVTLVRIVLTHLNNLPTQEAVDHAATHHRVVHRLHRHPR